MRLCATLAQAMRIDIGSLLKRLDSEGTYSYLPKMAAVNCKDDLSSGCAERVARTMKLKNTKTNKRRDRWHKTAQAMLAFNAQWMREKKVTFLNKLTEQAFPEYQKMLRIGARKQQLTTIINSDDESSDNDSDNEAYYEIECLLGLAANTNIKKQYLRQTLGSAAFDDLLDWANIDVWFVKWLGYDRREDTTMEFSEGDGGTLPAAALLAAKELYESYNDSTTRAQERERYLPRWAVLKGE